MGDDESRYCYPRSLKDDDERRTFKAEPHYVTCHCGRRIEQDEKGGWRHV